MLIRIKEYEKVCVIRLVEVLLLNFHGPASKQGKKCQLVIGITVVMSRMAAANHMMLAPIWVLLVHLSSILSLRLAKLMVAGGGVNTQVIQ